MIECFVPPTRARSSFAVSGARASPLFADSRRGVRQRLFEDAASVLASEFCVATYDRRGYSRSSGQLDESFLSASAKDAERICRQLFPAVSVAVVGCSAGGLIAMEFARRCPGACGAARPSRTAAAGVSPAVHGSAGHCEADSELPGAEKIHSGGEPLPGLVGRHGTFGKTKTAGDMRTGGKEPGLFSSATSFCLPFLLCRLQRSQRRSL